MTAWVFAGAGLLVGVLVVWSGHRMLLHRGSHASATADALGSFIDVFDPARARADRDLESHENMGEVLPSPDDDDHPRWTVDLHHGQVRIPRGRRVTPP
jgi:hypothetical protein